MVMSLEDWVDQEVTLTFENGVTETLKVEKKENDSYKVDIFLYNSRAHSPQVCKRSICIQTPAQHCQNA